MKEYDLNEESNNIIEDKVSKLKELFPEVVTEDKIDYEKLKLELGENIETNPEKYQFTWPGKTQAIKESQKTTTGTLRPCKEESKNWDTTENLYIEGDNLEVLKLLQKSYNNKIKMIYIDPPYNTGKDFVYKDDYKDNLEHYLEISGQTKKIGERERDYENVKISTNSETNGRYHSNWLNMMYPRLKLARNLLTDDGIILISIDEHEVTNLIKICEILFGEHNFIENFIWIKNSIKNLSKTTSTNHEYIIAYAKNIDILSEKKIFRILKPGINEVLSIIQKANNEKWSIKKTEDKIKNFYKENPDLKGISQYHYVDYVIDKENDTKKLKVFRLSDISAPKSTGKAETYDVIHPITKKPCKVPSRGWAYSQKTMIEHINNNLIYFYKDETHIPQFKKYLDTVTTEVMKSSFSDFTEGKKELMELFNGKAYFNNAKPTTVISKFVELINDDDIILDFFSGSATTAHAVMKMNSGNKGNRKFIMVQLPEPTDEKSEAYKAGYTNICEIGKERIRRAGDKILEESSNNDIDIGFKVFKLDSSNVERWDPDYNRDIGQTLLEMKDVVKQDRTKLDLVYEVMLKYGLDLTLPVETCESDNNTLYSVGSGALILCLDNNISKNIVEKILEIKGNSPVTRVVFSDSGFVSDEDKTNIKEILRVNGVDEFITI